MVKCHKCGIEQDKVTSGTCMCPVQFVLCTCGQVVKVGGIHYHVVENEVTHGTTPP